MVSKVRSTMIDGQVLSNAALAGTALTFTTALGSTFQVSLASLKTALGLVTSQELQDAVSGGVANSGYLTSAALDTALSEFKDLVVDPIAIYDVGSRTADAIEADATLMSYIAVRAFNLPANLVGSRAVAGTAAAAQITFSIRRNGTQIGTMAFAAGATTATFAMASAVVVNAGDVLTIVSPAIADANLADLTYTLAGTLA